MKRFILFFIVLFVVTEIAWAEMSLNTNINLRIGAKEAPTAVVTAVPTPAPTASPTKTFTFDSNFGSGSKGDKVVNLQMLLKVTPTGNFGPKTKVAVKKYQSDHGLVTSGFVGPKTRAALNADLASVTPVPTPSITETFVASVTPTSTVMVTPTVAPTKMEKPFDIMENHFQLGVMFYPASSISAGTLPPGFEFLSSNEIESEISVQLQFKNLALEANIPLGNGQGIEMQTYGSSLNKIELQKSFGFVGKVYPLNGMKGVPLFPFAGIGCEYDTVAGNFSMGGFPFESSQPGWTLDYVIGSDFELSGDLLASLYYEVRQVKVETTLPGVGTLDMTQVGQFKFGLKMCVF